MDDVKVEKFRLEDGRHAERHVRETDDERVVELHCEPEREYKLSQRLIEKKKPVVYERTIETVNRDGDIVERKTETLDPESKLELKAHIQRVKPKMEAVADERDATHPKRFVTREELKDAVVAALSVSRQAVELPKKLSAQQQIEQKITATGKPSWGLIAACVFIAAQAAAIAYVMFWM